MNKRVLYHKKTGEPVQLIAQAQTKPNYQDVVCYQELTRPYDYFVMERGAFFSTYTRGFDELPEKNTKRIEKHADLPDKQKSDATASVQSEPADVPTDPMEAKMLAFFDARTYAERIRIFEEMKDANEHILTNIAVSQDIALDESSDSYERIMSELKLRKKFEVTDRRPD